MLLIGTASERLAGINAALASGLEVWVMTYTRSFRVTPKAAAKWPADRPLFKVAGQSLYMGRGKRYDCIDFCHIATQEEE